MNNRLNRALDSRTIKQLKENANWFLILGISLVVLGTLGIIFSYVSTLFSVVYLGSFLIVLGIFEGIKSFKVHQWSNFFLHLSLSIVYTMGGFFIVFYPIINAISLTLLLALFFIVAGILRIVFSISKHTPHRAWLALNGLLTLLLGILIVYQWPLSGLWVIGMFVGIDILFTGWTWIMLSMAVKKIE